MFERITDDNLVPPAGLYSHATAVGAGHELVFIAEQLAINKKGEGARIPATLPDQFRLVFTRLGEVLASSGSTFEDVVKLTTFRFSSLSSSTREVAQNLEEDDERRTDGVEYPAARSCFGRRSLRCEA